MEIGDIFVINKCDQEGADRLEHSIRGALELAPEQDGWQPPIVRTVATTGEGIVELRNVIEACHAALGNERAGASRKRRATRERIIRLLEERAVAFALEAFGEANLDAAITAIIERKQDPYSVVDAIVKTSGLRRSS